MNETFRFVCTGNHIGNGHIPELMSQLEILKCAISYRLHFARFVNLSKWLNNVAPSDIRRRLAENAKDFFSFQFSEKNTNMLNICVGARSLAC